MPDVPKTVSVENYSYWMMDGQDFRKFFAGLGDWTPNKELLPDGIAGLSAKVEALGMKFGLWFEPEMVNADSDLYRSHPDWLLKTPHRHSSLTRHQYVLDFSRNDVVEHLYQQMSDLLRNAHILISNGI